MKPRGPLMAEHRLIERMIEIMRQRVAETEKNGNVDLRFIDTAVDFIRIYADRTHHGKEEDILFRECKKKDMSPEDAKVMNELVREHEYTRRTVSQLVEAKERYIIHRDTLDIILEKLNILVAVYPAHISKEDRNFFLKSEEYFTQQELQNMLEEFREFDGKMIHEKYRSVVDSLGTVNQEKGEKNG